MTLRPTEPAHRGAYKLKKRLRAIFDFIDDFGGPRDIETAFKPSLPGLFFVIQAAPI